MAGYSFVTSAVNNQHNQHHHHHHHNNNNYVINNNHQKNLSNRYSTVPLSSSTTFSLSNNRYKQRQSSTPKILNTKIIKNKNRIKMNSFQHNEREKFKKILMEHLNYPIKNKIFDNNRQNKSAIISSSSPSLKLLFNQNNHLRKQSFKNNNDNDKTIILPSSKLIDLKSFQQQNSLIIDDNNDNNQRKTSSSSTTTTTSRLNMIQDYWTLPDKSIDFKSSVENKISLVYTDDKTISSTSSTTTPLSKNFSLIEFNKNDENLINNNNKCSSVSDMKIYEKLNHIKILKNDRETITSKIKSMFEPFIPYNFYYKFKRFIPFLQDDHEISDELKKSMIENDQQQQQQQLTTIVPLTDEIENEINNLLAMNNPNHLLVSAYSISIYIKDILTLDGCNWLNDTVIEFYLNLIVSRSQTDRKIYPSVYAFSTYFFTRLYNGNGPGRWANKLDFFSYDLLLIPIHYSSHWRLVVVDNVKKSIEYYDSLGNEFRYCIELLIKFLQQESIKKKKIELNLNEWNIYYKLNDIPKQQNYYDCGVFACKYAEYISRRAPITFTQEHIPAFRKCMMYEIIHQQLLVV